MKRAFTIILSFLLIFSLAFVEPIQAKNASHESDALSSRPATGNMVFIFETSKLKWAVYDSDGQLIRTGRAVGGRSYCPDVHRGCRTPVGTFQIYHKVGPNFVSSKYPLPHGGAHMPWGMFFHKGYAIHGSNDMPSRHASHGCIRVYPSDAKWLNHLLPIGTTVIVRHY